MSDHRARVDADITFSNGGGIQARGFRLDVPAADTSREEIGRLLVASLGLLLTDTVTLTAVEVFEERHKGTREGPSDEAHVRGRRRLVELNHVIEPGMVTLPNLPGPEITTHLSREASRAAYAPDTTFEIGRISMVANTGTYVDSPYHRFASGHDLAAMALTKLAELPALVVRLEGSAQRGVTAEALAAYDVEGSAVLLHTGDDSRFGTAEYVVEPSFLTREGAAWLVARGAALVGIDAANIDDMDDRERPAHTILLGAGTPVVEHLTGLADVPPSGATFTAVPPRVVGLGTFPVRAFASVPA